jgi:hypothetical protein
MVAYKFRFIKSLSMQFCYLNPNYWTQKFRRICSTMSLSSGVGNWYLVAFFEEMINLSRADDISSNVGRLVVDYHPPRLNIICCGWFLAMLYDIHLQQMILIWRGWYSSRVDNIQMKQMILIWQGWYSSRADDIHPMETIFIQERRISSIMVDAWNYNQPLGITINHWGS